MNRSLALAIALVLGWRGAAMAQSPATATFVKSDATTSGNWSGVYGADGTQIAGYAASLPAYAAVTMNLPTGGNPQPFVWAASTTDARAPQAPGQPTTAARTAQCWHGVVTKAPGFSIDVNLTDGNPHVVAFYCVDWDAKNRTMQIQVADAATKAVLDTQSVSAFANGVYLQWNVTGHVVFTFSTAAVNAVASGIFFDTLPPGPPSNLAASVAGGTANLSWTAPTTGGAAASYNVYRSTDPNFTPGAANLIGTAAGTTYADAGLTAGTYYYAVAGVNAAGNAGAASAPQSAAIPPPGPPSGLTATPSGTTVNLSWTAPTTGDAVATYAVHRSTTPGFTPDATSQVGNSTTTTYADAGLTGGTYYYLVMAGDAANHFGPPSDQATALIGPVVVSPWVVKSGTLVAFGVNSTAAPKIAGAARTPAPIKAVNASPTVYRNGKAVNVGAPTWFSKTGELPVVFYRLNCGAVRTIAVADGGAGYTAAATVKWNGDGGGTSLTLGAPVLNAGAIQWVPITACSDDFTSPPTFTVTDPAATTPAVLYPIMAGVKPGDTITYDAPANWLSPVLGGHYGWAPGGGFWTGGTAQPVATVTGGAVDNWAGRLEGVSGGFGCFAQAPKMMAGANPGGQPSSPDILANAAKNRVKTATAWQISGGGALTTDADGNPTTWTKPATSTLKLWCHGPMGKGLLGDVYPNQPGQWTLQWSDPDAGMASATSVALTSRFGAKLVSTQTTDTTTTAVYDIEYPATAKTWELDVSVSLQAPAGPDGLGRYTITNLKVVAPDARDGSPQPIAAGESDLEPDPNAVRGLAGAGLLRFMDSTQNAGGGPDSQFIFPGDPVNPDAPSWNIPGKQIAANFVAARYYNTDPNSTTYAWSSPKIIGPQSLFASGLTLPPGDDGHSLADSSWLVAELRSAAPHGLTTGMNTSVSGAVPVPIAGTTQTFAPGGGKIGLTFVTSPTTIVAVIYPGTPFPSGPNPQKVGSATEIDLTAGGTKPGWQITGHGPNHSVPYRFTSKFASRMPGSALWTNLPVSGTDDLFASIATDLAKDLDPTNKIWLEYGNEIWNENGSSAHVLHVMGRLLGAVPSGTTVLGGRYTGTGAIPGGYTQYAASVPMSAHAFDVFTAAAQKAGIDPSRIETVYGSQFANAAYTQQIIGFAAKAQAQVDHIAVAPYWDMPGDPAVIAAFSPAGSRADAQAWPVDAINDFNRHAFAYSAIQQGLWSAHAGYIAASKQAKKPTLVCYEGSFETLVPNQVPNAGALTIDCYAHPSARDLIYGWYAACQQGDPTVPGSGASHASYHVVFNNITRPTWALATGTGQPAGDGSKNQYASYQGGFPADGHEHNAGPVRNVSPGLKGLQDWAAAVNSQPAQ